MVAENKMQKVIIMAGIVLLLWQVVNPSLVDLADSLLSTALIFLAIFAIDYFVTKIWK